VADPKNADAHNLMGYSLRKSGDFEQSLVHYQKALEIDPKHKSALEYLGELYVETKEIDKARATAARLKALCPQGCEELSDLEKTIAGAAGVKTRPR
jgi:cytochrome c-type biogenesis protein CcmH/NrfG